MIEDCCGLRSHILILDVRKLHKANASNPFPEAEAEPQTLHLFFLASSPPAPDIDALNEAEASFERFHGTGHVFDMHAPEGVGRSKSSVAEDLGCGAATVQRVRRLYRAMGISGLTPIKPPGRPSQLSETLHEPVREAVQTDPRTLDYGFTTWSVPRLTEHLRRRCRLRASPSTVRRVLAHERFSLQRRKHTLEGKRDEKAHAEAKKELSGLKNKRSSRTPPKRLFSKTKPKSTRTRC